jgi:hypothetical protein
VTQTQGIRAKGSGRIVTMTNGQVMNVALPWLTWAWLTIKHYLSMLFMSAKKKAKLQAKGKLPGPPVRDVQFAVAEIRSLRYSPPWGLFDGLFVVDAGEQHNDPWRKPGKRKPHRIKFSRGRRRSRWHTFATLAMGLDLVRPDLKPLAARGRLVRWLGFRGGNGPVEVKVPEQRSRHRRRVENLVGTKVVSVRGPAHGELPNDPVPVSPGRRPHVENT